jgi:hypothetical protein
MHNQDHHEETDDKIVQLEVSNLATALCKAQSVMSGAKKDKQNPFFRSRYADLASVFDAIRAPFASNGLSITQTMDVLADGQQVLCTRLMHVSGEFIDSKMLLPKDPNPQKLGSAITYMRRYSLMAIAGIPAEDDDGNQASGNPLPKLDYISSKQVADLERLINGNDKVRAQVLANCNNNMSSITKDRYPGAGS